jgi:hypothetical protein
MTLENLFSTIDLGLLKEVTLNLIQKLEEETDEAEKEEILKALKVSIPIHIKYSCLPNEKIVEFGKKYL